jgi:hypothetical protein
MPIFILANTTVFDISKLHDALYEVAESTREAIKRRNGDVGYTINLIWIYG